MKKKSLIFYENKFYNQNIKFFSKNLKQLLSSKKLDPKKLAVLDFGCGNCSLHKYISFKKTLLYDVNPYYIDKKRVKNSKKFKDFSHLKRSKTKVNLIIVNSVIQYIPQNELKIILRELIKKLKKGGYIIISDIPVHNRFLEIFYDLNIFFFFNVFLYLFRRIDYLKLNFHTYNDRKLIDLLKKRNIKFNVLKNLNLFKSRYTLLISKKK